MVEDLEKKAVRKTVLVVVLTVVPVMIVSVIVGICFCVRRNRKAISVKQLTTVHPIVKNEKTVDQTYEEQEQTSSTSVNIPLKKDEDNPAPQQQQMWQGQQEPQIGPA